MAVEIGTATNHTDLFDKLITFLTTNADLVAASQEWSSAYQDSTHVVFIAPGLSSAEEIVLGVEVQNNRFSIKGFLGFVPGSGYNQPGASNSVYTPLWDDTIPYWFIANGQRVVVVAHINTTYQSLYLGKILPYSTPSQYPMPLLVGGMSDTTGDYTDTSVDFIHKPNYSHCFLYGPTGSWFTVKTGASGTSYVTVEPYESRDKNAAYLSKIVPLDGATHPLFPLIYASNSSTSFKACIGEVDGIYMSPGYSQTSESIVTIDGIDHLLFQNGIKLGVYDFCAVRLT